MPLQVGPMPGNGAVMHVDDTIAIGYCEVTNGEIGNYIAGMFNIGQGWVENAVLCLLDGCQDIIDRSYGGNIGAFYMDRVMKRANMWAKDLLVMNPHPPAVGAMAKYEPGLMGVIAFEYTEGYMDTAGHPQFRFKPYP